MKKFITTLLLLACSSSFVFAQQQDNQDILEYLNETEIYANNLAKIIKKSTNLSDEDKEEALKELQQNLDEIQQIKEQIKNNNY